MSEGHEKVYGVCENKCFVEVEPLKNKLPIESHYEMARFKETVDGVEVERKVMHYCSGRLSGSEFNLNDDGLYFKNLRSDIDSLVGMLSGKVVIERNWDYQQYTHHSDYFELPIQAVRTKGRMESSFHFDGVGFSFDDFNTYVDKATIYLDYIAEVTD